MDEEDIDVRSLLDPDMFLDSLLEGGRDSEARSVWEAALDNDDMGREEVGGNVEAADDPPGLIPAPLYQPLILLILWHESGLCRAAKLDWVGLERLILWDVGFKISHRIVIAKNPFDFFSGC